MKYLTPVSFVFMLNIFGGCAKQHVEYSIEEFMNTTSYSGSSFSPDERSILFTSNKSGIYNAFKVDINSGETSQLTQSDTNSVFAISYFPNDERILYRSDNGGDELHHIFLLNTDGSVKDLTPGDNVRARFYGWAYGEESFYFGSNKRDARFMDIYRMDIASFQYNLIYKNDDALDFGAVSNDEKFIALSKEHTRYDSDMYLYDIVSKEKKHISVHSSEINYSPSYFSVDSKDLYFLTDEGSEFMYLKRYEIESGSVEKVQQEDWDIWYSYISRKGRYRVTGINADSKTKIKIRELNMDRTLRLPRLPDGDITSVSISKTESKFSFYHGGAKSPPNLYVMDLDTKKYQKLTDSKNPVIDESNLASVEVVRYKSFDGKKIPAVFYRPPHANTKNKVPALVWVHGGPGGQSRVGYRSLIQYLTNHGYAVLAVNNRGSSGYGKTFQSLDDRDHGGGDLDDCVWAKLWLKKKYFIDPDRIGIIGGSYGGFMVMAALAFKPAEFDVGVNIYGVTNWVRTLKSIPPWWEPFKESLYRELGDPNTMEDYLYSILPLFHAENIIKPTLVLQGANDPRVLKVESDEMVDAIKKKDTPVEYVVFDDEGHGFIKKKNQITANQAILRFLDSHLKNKES